MGYDLHLTRADHWPDSAMYPISLEEWIAVADAEPRMTKHQEAGKRPRYAYTNADGLTWALDWCDDGLAARPEWQLLNTVTPARISFNHDELC